MTKVFKYAGKGNGPQYMNLTTTAGRNRAVWEGRAMKTSPGGNSKSDLKENKDGKIVSKRRSKQGKKALQRMKDAGRDAPLFG